MSDFEKKYHLTELEKSGCSNDDELEFDDESSSSIDVLTDSEYCEISSGVFVRGSKLIGHIGESLARLQLKDKKMESLKVVEK